MGALNVQQLAFFGILAAVFALLISERLRPDVVAALSLLALAVTRILSPEEALSGFSSEPAIVIASIFVLSAGFRHTGLSDLLGRWAGRLAGKSLLRMQAVIMLAAALPSAFTHHVTITAIMLPVTLRLAKENDVPPSKLLLPMAIGSSLGTTILVIAAPSFLVASELLRQAGQPGLAIYSIAPIGLALTAAGIVYMLTIGRLLLPSRRGGQDAGSRFRLEQYFTELRILPTSPMVGKTLEQVHADPAHLFTAVGWMRAGRQLQMPAMDRTLAADDVLLVRTAPEELAAVHTEAHVELRPVAKYANDPALGGAHERDDGDANFVQAIIAPGSRLVGRTLGETDFRRQYGSVVLGLWRKQDFVPSELARTRLREGDVLVLQGDDDALASVAEGGDFLMLIPFHGESRRPTKAIVAAGIMLGVILTVTLGWLSLGIAVFGGAVAMVLSRCVTSGQAYRAIDARMYLFIAGAIPLGKAMQKTGAADLIAGLLGGVIGGWSQTLTLLAIFLVVGGVVQFMGSDAATTALFGPMAIALAATLGARPEPFIITVAMAAVTAVLTPMSHHNLLIYAPGGYRFSDFARVGAPLTLLLGAVVAVLAPQVWK
ncbi:MAG: SLC13 family permease [Chloroflexota bacterium]|nr:SLC13 family permease [Chloroflexota bacterium]